MSIIVKKGDTFARISRRVFGVETEANRIALANPHATEPLIEGMLLTVPDVNRDGLKTQIDTSEPDEVVLEINNSRFRFWTEVTIDRSMDRFDTIQFAAPFEPNNLDFRNTFRPLTFQSIRVKIGGELVFTGTMLDIAPSVDPGNSVVSVSGYSKPGVLNDCTPPATMFNRGSGTLEFNNQTLLQICKALCDPFAITVESNIAQTKTETKTVNTNLAITDEIQGFPIIRSETSIVPTDEGKPFEKVAIEPVERIYDFIVKLARRRRLLLGNNERGSLTIGRSAGVGKPVATLVEGVSPLVAVMPSFKPQDYFSHITALSPSVIGKEGYSFTIHNRNAFTWRKAHAEELAEIRARRKAQIKADSANDVDNPRSHNVLRPLVFGMDEGDSVDNGTEQESAQTKMGRMFANCVGYEVQVSTWRDPKGRLWKPNTTIILECPSAMVYRPFEFLIRGVQFRAAGNVRTATLNLVLPGGFDGLIPKVLPWD